MTLPIGSIVAIYVLLLFRRSFSS